MTNVDSIKHESKKTFVRNHVLITILIDFFLSLSRDRVVEWEFSNIFINFIAFSNFKKFVQTSFFDSHFIYLKKYLTSRFVILLTISFLILKNLILSLSSFINTDCDEKWFDVEKKENSKCAIEITEWIRQCCDMFKRYVKLSILSIILNESTYCWNNYNLINFFECFICLKMICSKVP